MKVPEFLERGKSIAYKSTCFQKKFIAKNLEQSLSIIEAQREALGALLAIVDDSGQWNRCVARKISSARRVFDMDA